MNPSLKKKKQARLGLKNYCIWLVIFTIFWLADCTVAQTDNTLNLIPQPVSREITAGSFTLTAATKIITTKDEASIRNVAQYLAEHLSVPTGYEFTISSADNPKDAVNTILFELASPNEEMLGKEGYRLAITTTQVGITANTPNGLFYGVQTLLQLLPTQIESPQRVPDVEWKIECGQILDYPRFAWRGLLLDVSRHFFTMEQVKDYIDTMARYKFNTLHLHLTDDQGWRIQINKYPRLTEVGAWRVPRVGKWGKVDPPAPEEKATYGGFYTQQDIRELVRYAQAQFITIVPEIDVPGHSMAALASYPNLSCTGGPFQVNPGNKFYRTIENTLCAGNEEVFTFLDGVLGEVAELFPSPYIHIGGDEAFKGFWAKCPKCQARKKEHDLKNEDELQSYFIKRAEKILESKGKLLIGWDEILEGGLAPNATVMSWRGIEGGVTAAKMGHKVVMSPRPYYYLDLYQGDPVTEAPTYSMSRLRNNYEFDPVPEEIDPALVLGVQGNLWTEEVYTLRHAQYMTWPRGFTVAEAGWSPKGKKDWPDFRLRVERQFQRMDAARVKYATTMYDTIFIPEKSPSGELLIKLDTELEDLDIYYTFDGSYPDLYYPKYTEPLTVPLNALELRVVTYRGDKPIGKQIIMPIETLKKRAGL